MSGGARTYSLTNSPTYSLTHFLHCTRALGDRDEAGCKPPGLSAVPEVRSLRLCAEDEFVLLASDGLWDVVDPATAVAAAREELRAYGETTPYTPPPQPATWP